MNNVNLQNLILADCDRIAQAISTGAAWEIWMQVELVLILRAAGVQAAREVPYPPPNQRLSLDCRRAGQCRPLRHRIEGGKRQQFRRGDHEWHQPGSRASSLLFPPHNPGARWAVGIGYSVAALNALAQFAGNPANAAIFGHRGGIGVLVATV